MAPQPGELRWIPACVHLTVEELRDGLIIERDAGHRDLLMNRQEVLNEQEIIRRRDAKATDFGTSPVPEEEQLGPGGGAESQDAWFARGHDPLDRLLLNSRLRLG